MFILGLLVISSTLFFELGTVESISGLLPLLITSGVGVSITRCVLLVSTQPRGAAIRLVFGGITSLSSITLIVFGMLGADCSIGGGTYNEDKIK